MTTPKTPKRRTPAEIWEKLVEEAGEKEIEAACALSEEEVEAYLRANGFDVEAEKAKAEAFLDALGGRKVEGKPGPERGGGA